MTPCPRCRESFESLGTHLRFNPDHRPELTTFQRDLLRFLALVGVAVDDRGDHPRLKVYDTDRDFLAAVSDALGWLAKPPRRHREAASDEGRTTDVWSFTTLPHPELSAYTSPSDVTSLTPRVARWLVLAIGEWVASGPFGSLWLDTRGLTVDGDHVRRLLRDAGVREFCESTKWPTSLTHRGHWRDEIVALPHGWGLSLVDAGGLDLGDVEHTGRIQPLEEPLDVEADLAA